MYMSHLQEENRSFLDPSAGGIYSKEILETIQRKILVTVQILLSTQDKITLRTFPPTHRNPPNCPAVKFHSLQSRHLLRSRDDHLHPTLQSF
jgi:hypothetical protein